MDVENRNNRQKNPEKSNAPAVSDLAVPRPCFSGSLGGYSSSQLPHGGLLLALGTLEPGHCLSYLLSAHGTLAFPR